MDHPKAVCFTGHRPQGLPWGEDMSDPRCQAFLRRLSEAVDAAITQGYRHFICGNATGVDTWAAEIVLAKKLLQPDITLEIALPFADHNKNIPECQAVMLRADLVHVVGRSRNRRRCFFERNEYMVDHSSLLIAAWDATGLWKGGTGQTYNYAISQGVEVVKVPYYNSVTLGELKRDGQSCK